MQAIPWLLLSAAVIILIIAVIQMRIQERDLDDAAAEIKRLTDEQRERNAAFGQELAQVQLERDLARRTVRDLLDAQRAGYRYPRPLPLPMPPDVDNALTEEFTKIIGRHVWPKSPEPPS